MKSTLGAVKIIFARKEDAPEILAFIRDLAIYEKLEHELTATVEQLEESLFGARPYAEVLFIEVEKKRIGFAIFFHNFSTFLGAPGIYLEDLYVRPEWRGRGYGQMLMKYLARLAIDRKCGRLEWWVLDWNQPAIRFYQSLGAVPMLNWTVQRVSGNALQLLASGEISSEDQGGKK